MEKAIIYCGCIIVIVGNMPVKAGVTGSISEGWNKERKSYTSRSKLIGRLSLS